MALSSKDAGIRRTVQMVFSLIRRDSELPVGPIDVLIVAGDGNRAARIDKVAYSPLANPLEEELSSRGVRCEMLALPFSRLIKNRAWGYPMSFNRKFLKHAIRHTLENRWSSFCRLFGVESRGHANGPSHHLIRFWMWILEGTRARAIVVINSPEPLTIAAKLLGVTHYELQHGYGWNQELFDRARITEWYASGARQVPPFFLAFDSESSSFMRRLAPQGLTVLEVQSPEIYPPESQEWVRRLGGPRVMEFSDLISAKKKYIVFSTQWLVGLGGRIPSHVFESRVLPLALIEAVKATDDIMWLVRLHPLQLVGPRRFQIQRSLRRELRNLRNVEWKTTSELPLSLILNEASGLVTAGSAGSALQAAASGVPSLICGYGSSFKSGQESGIAKTLVEQGYSSYGSWHSGVIVDFAKSANKKSPLSLFSGGLKPMKISDVVVSNFST